MRIGTCFWFKMPDNFFNNKYVRALMKGASGYIYVTIYIKMLLLSAEHNGTIYFDEIEDTPAEEVALMIDENKQHVSEAMELLEGYGLITYSDHRICMTKYSRVN